MIVLFMHLQPFRRPTRIAVVISAGAGLVLNAYMLRLLANPVGMDYRFAVIPALLVFVAISTTVAIALLRGLNWARIIVKTVLCFSLLLPFLSTMPESFGIDAIFRALGIPVRLATIVVLMFGWWLLVSILIYLLDRDRSRFRKERW